MLLTASAIVHFIRYIWSSNTGSKSHRLVIAMQIGSGLAAANHAKFRLRLRKEDANSGTRDRAVACILMLLHIVPSI